jgi:ubiquinol-cytochrome c reductase cytochrome c1 subunit
VALGAGGDVPPMSANTDITDKKSLQSGARVFVNYCMGCHSMEFMRYSRMADDIGLDRDLVAEHLMFTTDKIGDSMTIAMRADDASGWFGIPPPDLSVIARARGIRHGRSASTTSCFPMSECRTSSGLYRVSRATSRSNARLM